jgi:hypothetical protein
MLRPILILHLLKLTVAGTAKIYRNKGPFRQTGFRRLCRWCLMLLCKPTRGIRNSFGNFSLLLLAVQRCLPLAISQILVGQLIMTESNSDAFRHIPICELAQLRPVLPKAHLHAFHSSRFLSNNRFMFCFGLCYDLPWSPLRSHLARRRIRPLNSTSHTLLNGYYDTPETTYSTQ